MSIILGFPVWERLREWALFMGMAELTATVAAPIGAAPPPVDERGALTTWCPRREAGAAISTGVGI